MKRILGTAVLVAVVIVALTQIAAHAAALGAGIVR